MDLTTLRRSPAPDAKIAGVCSGLATAWGVDPLVVRTALVVLTLGGGVGLVLYAAAWLALPPAGSDRAILDTAVPGWRRWPTPVLVAGLVVVALVASIALQAVLPLGIAPSLVLLAVWFFGFHRPRRREAEARRRAAERSAVSSTPSAPFAEQTEFTRLAAAWQQRVHEHRAAEPPPPPAEPSAQAQPSPGVDLRSGGASAWPSYSDQPGYSLDAFLADPDPAGLYADPEPAAAGATRVAARRDRRARVLAWGAVAAAGLALGAVALLDVFLDVGPAAYPAAVLLVIGLALVLGTRLGRPRGFLALGVVLCLVTLGALAPGPGHDAGTRVVATSTAEIPARLVRDTGSVAVDLSQVQLTEDRRMEVTVDAGQIHVRVPADARVRVEYSLDAGSASILGKHDSGGLDIADTVDDQGSGTGPLLTVVAHVDVGTVEVVR